MQSANQKTSMDFRRHLQSELVLRCQKNPQYSLRSFAKLLGVEPSSLSRILRGQRNLTRTMLYRLAMRLDMDSKQIEQFETQHFSEPLPSREPKEKRVFRPLSESHFHISEWYCYALLELTRLEDFDPRPKSIAKRLGISVSQANIAIERLTEAGMIKVGPQGKIEEDTENRTTTLFQNTTEALKKAQRDLLAKASEAMDSVDFEKRDQSSMTMAISQSKIRQAKLKIQKFRRELSQYLEADPRKDAVYHLSISLFPLTLENRKTK